LKYNLTPDIIESIFKTYPAVRRKHADHVPAKMTEQVKANHIEFTILIRLIAQEFWTKFFHSHYFHRDRVHGLGGVKDLFTECAKEDDRAIREQLRAGVEDAAADLSAFSDRSLTEGFGAGEGENPALTGDKAVDKANARNASNIVQQVSLRPPWWPPPLRNASILLSFPEAADAARG